MSYIHPYKDATFCLEHIVDFEALCQSNEQVDANMELAVAVLDEAGKIGSEVLAPLNQVGDLQGPTIGDLGVEASPGFNEAYQQFAESGWLSLAASEAMGGQNMPNVLSTAVNEIWHSANMAFALCPMLSQGAMESIAHHASEELQAVWLPKMVSGEWTGTMNLTEPDAGSDLAAIKSQAIPEGDHYLISGQKIFITWGDHQMTNNVVHLVLARLPDAPAGVKGISLFIVPKFTLDAAGEPATRNGAHCLSIEHKLGIHGSPTCVMEFASAEGYLVGEPHKGLAYMFTMMNHARQAVGLQGLSISERAYQLAVVYAKERLQGTRRDGSRIPIIEFPDVRRMLLTMKSSIEAMRGLAFTAAAELDRAAATQDTQQKAYHNARFELLTPIVKGWLTEMSQELTSLGVQIHGGMGFIEETGAAQHFRDARILTIYEGTTGIQALDLVGRKTLMNKGEALQCLLDEMRTTLTELIDTDYPDGSVTTGFDQALQDGMEACEHLLASAAGDKHHAGSASVNFMMLFGYLCGGWGMVRGAMNARAMLDTDEGDREFLTTKLQTTRFYCEHILPRTKACLAVVKSDSDVVMAMSDDQF